MNKNLIINLLINISIIFLGLLILFKPDVGITFFRFYLGIILIIGSLSFLYLFKTSEDSKILDLFKCIALLVLGLFFLISASFSMITVGLIIGIWMIFESVMDIQLILQYRKANFQAWKFILGFVIVALAMAFFILQDLTIAPTLLMRLAAIFIIFRSIIILLDFLVYQRKIANQVVVYGTKKDDFQ